MRDPPAKVYWLVLHPKRHLLPAALKYPVSWRIMLPVVSSGFLGRMCQPAYRADLAALKLVLCMQALDADDMPGTSIQAMLIMLKLALA